MNVFSLTIKLWQTSSRNTVLRVCVRARVRVREIQQTPYISHLYHCTCLDVAGDVTTKSSISLSREFELKSL